MSKRKPTSRQEIFEKLPVKNAILKLSVPTIISQLINVVYNVADTFYVGRTGNAYMIAGVSLAFTLFIFNISISNLFGMGGGSLMARLLGIGRDDKARNVCALSFYGTLFCGAMYSLLIYAFITPLLNLLGASPDTYLYSRQYTMLVVVAGTVPVVLSGTMAHLLRNTGLSKLASFGLSGGGILNIILDPLFMFVIFDPGMEVFAAALATLLSNIFAAVFFIIIIIRESKKGGPLSLSFNDALKVDRSGIREIFSVGIPSSVLPGLFDIANILLNSQMAAHGDLQLAAIGIVMKAERIPNAIGVGMSQGMIPLVAYNYSSGNHKRMKEVIKTGRRMGFIIACACLVFYWIFAKNITGFFIDTNVSDPLVREKAIATLAFAGTFLKFRCLASPVQFLNYQSSFCMQAIGDGKSTLIHAVVRMLVFCIPFMFILNAVFGETGLSGALALSEAVSSILAMYLLRRLVKKTTSLDI